jgi:hypothetical protein
MHRASSKVGLVVAVLLASIPATASAAAWRVAESEGLMSPYGEYFLLGAGATDFTDSALKDFYDMGLTWDARLGFGSRSFLGLEVAYVGAMRSAAVGDNDITQHGAEANLRLQYPYVMGPWLIEPFALGGIGWSRLSIDNVPGGAEDTDNLGVIPLGAGITVGYGRFLIDGRFTYRATFSEDIGEDLQNWAVVGSLGYEF